MFGSVVHVEVFISNSPTGRKSGVVACKVNRAGNCGSPYGWNNFYKARRLMHNLSDIGPI
jgi:hypothetical protein